jgi:hypothetical protein
MESLPDINVSQNRIADAEHAKVACCISIRPNIIAYLKTKSKCFVEPIIERLRFDRKSKSSS